MYTERDPGFQWKTPPCGPATLRMSFRWGMFNALNYLNPINPNLSNGGASAGPIGGTAAALEIPMAIEFSLRV